MKPKVWKYVGWTAGTLIVAGLVVACVGAIRATATAGPPPELSVDPFKASGDGIEVDNDAIATAGIQILTVQPKDIPLTLTLTGRTGFNMEAVAHVHAQFGGKVKEVGPQLGAMVSGPEAPGGPTLLCVIQSNDLAQAKSNFLQSKVQLKLDQDNLARTKELVKSTVLADKFLLDAESAVAKSTAALEAARQQLLVFGLTQKQIDEVGAQEGRQRMDYVITSPRSGVVAEKGVSGGEVADPTVNLFTIADTSTMWVWGDVYERDLRRVKIGQDVRIVFTSDPDRPRHCTIDWISPVLDPNTHSVRVRGTLENADGHLLADMYGTMVVTVDEGKNSIVLPSDCVVRQGSESYVFAKVARGLSKSRFRRVKVTVEPVEVGFGVSGSAVAASTAEGGNRSDGQSAGPTLVRITAGVRPGDCVVQSGALGLFNEIEQQSKQ